MLPVHHVDSCVLLPDTREEVKISRRYMKFAGEKYLVKVSIPALGECLMHILEIESSEKRHELFDFVIELKRYLQDISSIKNSHRHIRNIAKLDNRIGEMDRLIFACAVEDKADFFITTDNSFLRSHKLSNGYKIKIRHPKDAPRFS